MHLDIRHPTRVPDSSLAPSMSISPPVLGSCFPACIQSLVSSLAFWGLAPCMDLDSAVCSPTLSAWLSGLSCSLVV